MFRDEGSNEIVYSVYRCSMGQSVGQSKSSLFRYLTCSRDLTEDGSEAF